MDPGERLHRGQDAARDQRYQEALEDYLWFHEHALECDSAYYGVRLSFALASWIELGQAYPPAEIALRNIRDRKTKALLSGAEDRELFQDVAAINRYLNEHRATYEFFLDIASTTPKFAASCADIAMPALVKTKDYRLARNFIGEPEENIRLWSSSLSKNLAALDQRQVGSEPAGRAYISIYAEDVGQLLEVLAGVGETEQAHRLRELAIATVDSSIRQAVRVALQRNEGA